MNALRELTEEEARKLARAFVVKARHSGYVNRSGWIDDPEAFALQVIIDTEMVVDGSFPLENWFSE